jgi:hypothetical protein
VAGITNTSAPGRELRGSDGKKSGFTLLDVSFAVALLVVALMALSATAMRLQGLNRASQERTAAQNAVRAKVEEIQSISHAGVTDPLGWPAHVLGALHTGAHFDVKGLSIPDGATSTGIVIVVTDETATDASLGAQLGMPRDLDGDGLVSSGDVSAHARLLPVIVRVRWMGSRGVQQVDQPFWVMGC